MQNLTTGRNRDVKTVLLPATINESRRSVVTASKYERYQMTPDDVARAIARGDYMKRK